MANKDSVDLPDVQYPVLIRVKRFGDNELRKQEAEALKHGEKFPERESLIQKIVKYASMFILLPEYGAAEAGAEVSSLIPKVQVENIGRLDVTPSVEVVTTNDTLPVFEANFPNPVFDELVEPNILDGPIYAEGTGTNLDLPDPLFPKQTLRDTLEQGKLASNSREEAARLLNRPPKKPMERFNPFNRPNELKELPSKVRETIDYEETSFIEPLIKEPSYEVFGVDNPAFEPDTFSTPNMEVPISREEEASGFDSSFFTPRRPKQSTPLGRKPKRGNIIELKDIGGGHYVTKYEKLSETRFQEPGVSTRKGMVLHDIEVNNISSISHLEPIPEETFDLEMEEIPTRERAFRENRDETDIEGTIQTGTENIPYGETNRGGSSFTVRINLGHESTQGKGDDFLWSNVIPADRRHINTFMEEITKKRKRKSYEKRIVKRKVKPKHFLFF